VKNNLKWILIFRVVSRPQELVDEFVNKRNGHLLVGQRISVLSKLDKETYANVECYRDLLKYFNSLGGVTLLDSLDEKDIKEIIHEKLGLKVLN
jgi:hypothetical protein